ncbi:MAG: hypothetical protein UY21_C0025G0005 [Microgenomates group bacterium GW2011_GWA1_48_10]|nr:MAG: hypothetical protein UY21_C0025G0005 [Microgenomates group bacterium GW2011_GWA1_48_10]
MSEKHEPAEVDLKHFAPFLTLVLILPLAAACSNSAASPVQALGTPDTPPQPTPFSSLMDSARMRCLNGNPDTVYGQLPLANKRIINLDGRAHLMNKDGTIILGDQHLDPGDVLSLEMDHEIWLLLHLNNSSATSQEDTLTVDYEVRCSPFLWEHIKNSGQKSLPR